ncbi:MAG: AMP-binding protein [Synergistaceae bacterium]|nr:AMP-binding protein [Synergistaceae bacterium]
MFTNKTYYQIFTEQAALHPDKDAVVMGDKRVTYKQLIENIDAVSSYLVKHGVKKNDHVVIWGSPSPEWLCTYYGIVHAGGVAVCLNSNYSINDVTPLVTFADSKYVLYGATHDTKGVASEAEMLAKSFELPQDKVFSYLETDFASCEKIAVDDSKWDIKDDAYIIYTSGTTSFPKAVLTSQYSMINCSLIFADEFKSIRGTKACVALPLFHAFGLSIPCIYLCLGGTVYIPEKVKADAIADIVNREHVSDLWSVAAVYQSIIDSKDATAKCAPYVRMCGIAGSYTSPVQFVRFETALNNATFLNMFGMTETATVFIMARPEDNISVRHNTIGRRIPEVEIGICGENNQLLPAGEVGELVTRGFHVKNGYYKLPPEKQAIDENGWFHTGDLGVMDEDGNVRIAGRIKDIIIKGGENITPGEIEAQAISLEGIKECRIFGFKDRLYGENLGACITLKEGAKFDEDALRKHLKETVGSFKVPAYFFIYDKFPLNATGKIDQRKLHVDMLMKLRTLELEGELKKGVEVSSVVVKNTSYAIDPLISMIEGYAMQFGFDVRKARRIRLASEEMLIERIMNAFDDVGDIHLDLVCFSDYLRLTFKDSGQPYDFEKQRKTSESAKIIAFASDDMSITKDKDGHNNYNLDFLFSTDFDIKNFLATHERLL